MNDLSKLQTDLAARIAAAADLAVLEALRVEALGKTGSISELLKTLGKLSPDERRERGPLINGLRDAVAVAIAEKKSALDGADLDARLASERVDLSLPAPPERRGRVHPTMQVLDEMIAVFAEMGFSLAEGPDIEDDFHNFSALNFPPKHPAREMHDTFWLPEDERGERRLLRTHTSPVQVRVMRAMNAKLPAWIADGQAPPIRVIVPGRVYRSDSDATHTPMFHQMEGLVIDRTIHLGHVDAGFRRRCHCLIYRPSETFFVTLPGGGRGPKYTAHHCARRTHLNEFGGLSGGRRTHRKRRLHHDHARL